MNLRPIKITRPAPAQSVEELAYRALYYQLGDVTSRQEAFLAAGKLVKVSTLDGTHYFNSRVAALVFCRRELIRNGYDRARSLPLID